MNVYNYSAINDFVSATNISISLLSSEITDSTITRSLINIVRTGDQVGIDFDSPLTTADRVELDAVIEAHEGLNSSNQILETVILAPLSLEIKNATEWQELGGVLAAPLDFGEDITELKAQVTGLYKGSGQGMELNVVEKGSWNQLADVDIVNPALNMNSTGGVWAPFTVYSNINVRPGFWSYIVQARCGQAVDMFIRHLSLSVIKVL